MDQYKIKWRNHNENFVATYTVLRNNKEMFDVTLVAESKELQAHRVVLAAGSPFFHSLFTANNQQERQPIVYLEDMTFSNLQTIVDFMYHGEVIVSQENLAQVLASAKFLKVKGLSDVEPAQMTCSQASSFPHGMSCEPAVEKLENAFDALKKTPSYGLSEESDPPAALKRRSSSTGSSLVSIPDMVIDEGLLDNDIIVVSDSDDTTTQSEDQQRSDNKAAPSGNLRSEEQESHPSFASSCTLQGQLGSVDTEQRLPERVEIAETAAASIPSKRPYNHLSRQGSPAFQKAFDAVVNNQMSWTMAAREFEVNYRKLRSELLMRGYKPSRCKPSPQGALESFCHTGS